LFRAGLLRCVGEAADGDGQRLCHHLTCPVGDTTKERVSSSRLAATKTSRLGVLKLSTLQLPEPYRQVARQAKSAGYGLARELFDSDPQRPPGSTRSG